MKRIGIAFLFLFLLTGLCMTAFAAGEPAAQVISGNTVQGSYNSVQQAFDAAKDQPNTYVRLMKDTQESATVTGTVYLDLNGHDLSGITVTGKLYGMDSATDNYAASSWGKLTLKSGAAQVKTTFGKKDYVRLSETGGYSFHRYSIAITSGLIEPESFGIGYKATFSGDEAVKNALDANNAFGMAVQLTSIPETLEGNVYRYKGRDQYISGTFFQKMVISGILSDEATDIDIRGRTPIYARAYIRLADGTTLFSKQAAYNLKDLLELVDARLSQYNSEQQAAVCAMVEPYIFQISNWNIPQLHHKDTSLWQPFTGTVADGGHYYLTGDVNINSTLDIPANTSVTICLNGHDLIGGDNRMINIRGELTIHDHADAEGNFAGDMISHRKAMSMGSVFYLYDNATFNLCGGNLTVAEGVTAGRGCVGVLGNGGTTSQWATMNMYGGKIHGGIAKPVFDDTGENFKSFMGGSGGNLDLNSHSRLNMYGGIITGGTSMAAQNPTTGANLHSSGNGGNISVGSACELNIYGGEITGGTSEGGNGGNICCNGSLNIYGGTITGGTANSLVYQDAPVANTGLGDGIYLTTKDAVLAGNPQIYGNNGTNLQLNGFVRFNADDLGADAKVGISTAIRGALTGNMAAVNAIFSDDTASKVARIGSQVVLVPADLDAAAVANTGSVFRVGYSMNNITPQEDGLVMSGYGNPNGRLSSGVNYELYATTISITDAQNNTILMVTIDIQNCDELMMATAIPRISAATGVPQSNIYLSATHTHNCPTYSSTNAKNIRYRYLMIDALVCSALQSMADRAPATMETGSFDTQGMNYSRHYYYINDDGEKVYFGDQFGKAPTDNSKVVRVREGDTTMHMLAFNREGKQNVLMVNWRAHPHRSGGKTSYTIDADVIGALREYIHTKTDYQFAYFQGAAGNMNTTSRISGQTYKPGEITAYGNELGRQLKNGLAKLEPVETGLVQTKQVVYAANIDHSEDSRYEEAVALNALYSTLSPTDDQTAIANSYGFSSFFHAQRLITKYKLGATKDLQLNMFSIGEHIGFYTAPGELWDSVSVKMENDSPFDMTFCVGYSNGNVAYIPYQVDYSSYEYHYCLFTQDETINTMMEIYTAGLKELFGKA